MNKYFDKNDTFNSNSRIYEGFFTEASECKNGLHQILEMLCLILRSILESSAFRYVKVALVALSLVGLIGVIGAVEAGSLGMGSALLIGAVLVYVEYLCIRPRHRG